MILRFTSGDGTGRSNVCGMRLMRSVVLVTVLGVAAIAPAATESAGAAPSAGSNGIEVTTALQHDTSAPLATMTPSAAAAPSSDGGHGHPARNFHPGQYRSQGDGALQSTAGTSSASSSPSSFAGVGNGDYGFSPDAAPPDTNGAVGATQYVQWVNESFAVFDKTTHALVMGPKPANALWSGFGGGCEANNDGDPIVQYDKSAQRWILTQFSVSTTPYLQCVAVSQTSDATGAYYRYAFQQPNFNDYPKLGVWPDGYYETYNMFQGNSFVGARACAMNRTAMLSGASATQQCAQLTSAYGGLLPADVDGTTAPPAGTPETLMSFGSNVLNQWKFHVDWTTPANSTFTGPTATTVASFTPACNGGTCIPQPGTRQKLDSLADRLMYRLAYRSFGSYESLVVNHSVAAGSATSGIRWYELRRSSPTAAWSVYQQGTYAPDSKARWMGSIAEDKVGDIAVGYSVSSTSSYPAIAYAVRTPADASGKLEAETIVQAGGGSQQRNLNRWGDYSAMSVDPVDDCTFWYTNEYLKSSGTFNWSTRIASFKVTGCS